MYVKDSNFVCKARKTYIFKHFASSSMCSTTSVTLSCRSELSISQNLPREFLKSISCLWLWVAFELTNASAHDISAPNQQLVYFCAATVCNFLYLGPMSHASLILSISFATCSFTVCAISISPLVFNLKGFWPSNGWMLGFVRAKEILVLCLLRTVPLKDLNAWAEPILTVNLGHPSHHIFNLIVSN